MVRLVRGIRLTSGLSVVALALALTACARRPTAPHRKAKAPSESEATFAAGATAFSKYCALCHGAEATGYTADHAPSLVSWTFLESASDEFISRGIREGRPGTAMAGYAKGRGGPLDDADVAAIVHFLRSYGPSRVRLPPTPVIGDPVRGEDVYARSCKACHGTRTDRGFAIHLANPALLSAASDAFLRFAVVHGRPGTPMPGFEGTLPAAEVDDVVAALRSWATPVAPVRPGVREPPPVGEAVINPGGKTPRFELKGDRYVPIADVKDALDAKQRMVIIDARAASDWFTMHVPGSISVPYYLMSRLDSLPRDGTWIIAYCACPHHASGVVVDELRKRGFTRTAVADEGILEWKKRGYPIASEPLPADAGAADVRSPSMPLLPRR